MEKQKIYIRKADYQDAEAIVSLSLELGYTTLKQDVLNKLGHIRNNPDEEVFIAESNSHIAGWMHISLVEPIGSYAFVEIRGLVVSAEYRKRGMGTRLIKRAEEWCREKGIGKLRVRTNVIREETRKYYRNLKFRSKKTQEVFEKEISLKSKTCGISKV